MPFPSWSTRIALALVVWTAPLGAQSGADLAERLFRSGEKAYAARTYAEAFETWKQLVQQVPESPFAAEALLRQARHYTDVEGKPELALPLLDRLRNDYIKSPSAPEALLLRGEVLVAKCTQAQDLREAIAEFHRVVDLFPDHPVVPKAHFDLGLAFRDQGQWEKAQFHFLTVLGSDPEAPLAARSRLQMAEILDFRGDLLGCLKLLQSVKDHHPESPEALEASWKLNLRVRQRILKAPLKSQGPWPEGKQKWLNTPTLLALSPQNELFIYIDDTQLYRLKGTELTPVGPPTKGVKALVFPGPWQISSKVGIVKDEKTTQPLPPGATPSGAMLDRWGGLWIGDGRNADITILAPDGQTRTVPCPSVSALAPMPLGGAVVASDANRTLLFLDATGHSRLALPYGKDLPSPFRTVMALASDPVGNVAALVDGDFEGVVVWGPDGTPTRFATFKSLGLSGRFRGLALDRQGGILLADRTNDLLVRLD